MVSTPAPPIKWHGSACYAGGNSELSTWGFTRLGSGRYGAAVGLRRAAEAIFFNANSVKARFGIWYSRAVIQIIRSTIHFANGKVARSFVRKARKKHLLDARISHPTTFTVCGCRH